MSLYFFILAKVVIFEEKPPKLNQFLNTKPKCLIFIFYSFVFINYTIRLKKIMRQQILKFIFLQIVIFLGLNNCYSTVFKDININYSVEIESFNPENQSLDFYKIQNERFKENKTGIIVLIIAGVIQLALLTLQITGLISISWLLVLLPAILSVSVLLGIFLFVAIAFIIAAFQE